MLEQNFNIIANIHKMWHNFGTYDHSRLISLFVQIGLHGILKILQTFYVIMDLLPHIYNNNLCLSTELRSFRSLLYIMKKAIQHKKTWPILNNSVFSFDFIFLRTWNAITNYGLGSGVTIIRSADIIKQTLYRTHFIVTCADKLKEIYNISFDKVLSKTAHDDYNDFCPHDVEYLWISGNDDIARDHSKIIVYIHGGGYSLGGPSHVGYLSRLSLCTNTKVLFVWYAKPPIADIPFQVDQILSIYFYLLLYLNMDNKRIVFCGDSAGGGLITLFLQKLSLLNLASMHPLGIILSSPWVDLTMDNNSWMQCQFDDGIVDKTYVSRSVLIAVGNDERNLRSPFFSAIYAAEYTVDCNVMIFVSKHECLYDDSQRLVEVLRDSNTFNEYTEQKTKTSIFEDVDDNGNEDKELIFHEVDYVPHAYLIFYTLFPEADHAMDQVCETLDKWFDVKSSAIGELVSNQISIGAMI